jgi:hypothetical protein
MIEINLTKRESKRVWVKDAKLKGGGYWALRLAGKKDETKKDKPKKITRIIDILREKK